MGIARDSNASVLFKNRKTRFPLCRNAGLSIHGGKLENQMGTLEINLMARYFVTAAFMPLLGNGDEGNLRQGDVEE